MAGLKESDPKLYREALRFHKRGESNGYIVRFLCGSGLTITDEAVRRWRQGLAK
jgi:hypothetical protein